MPHLELSLLGPFEAVLDGKPITGFQSNKVRALLAYLAVESDRPHRREALAGLLWPDWPERDARNSLRNALSDLRRVLGDRDAARPYLQVAHDTLQFDPGTDAWLDVRAFEGALDGSAAHCPQGGTPCDRCMERLERATALYGGDLLQEFSLPDSPAFEEWALLQREHLRRRITDALGRLAEGQEGRGAHADAADTARRWVELEPWEERAHRALIRALALDGQRSAALVHYQACCATLEEELGVAPEPETLRLVERVRDGTLAQDVRGAPDRAEDAATTAQHVPSNLPAQLIPLVGRAALLEQILACLRDPGCRLLTLVGPGGSGKTRLAIEAAKRILDGGSEPSPFSDGACFVALASLYAPEDVPATLVRALGLSSAEEGDSRAQLLGYLRERRLLLVLDNLEHLLEGVDLAVGLLEWAPGVKVLATSRARLDVPGEQLFPIPGLDVPPAAPVPAKSTGEEGRYSAVQLFLQSARRLRPGYRPGGDELAQVAQVCRLVGGMPLGILLAAAWVQAFSPAQIAIQLSSQLGPGLDLLDTDWHGVPARQRAMRAVFDHSWGLLTAHEQEVMAALSLFRTPFSWAAAREVADVSPRDVLRLVGKSLLERTSSGRYALQELLRQYAAGKLEAEPGRAEAARDRHAAHYATAMERWWTQFQEPGQRALLTEVEGEIADVRAAWDWAVERGQAGWLGRALDGVFCLWELRRFDEVEAMFVTAEGGLAPVAARSPAPVLVLRVLSTVLAWHSFLLYWERRHYRRARELSERSLALLDRPELAGQDLRRERAYAWLCRAEGGTDLEYEEAARLCQRSLALYRELGERWCTAYALERWGHTAARCGEWEEAQRLFEQSDALLRELGLQVSRTGTLYSLSIAAEGLGQFEEVERLAQENLALRQGLSQEDAGIGYYFLGTALGNLGRRAEARSALEKAIAVCHRLGLISLHMSMTAEWIVAGVHLGQYEEALQHCQVHVAECRKLGRPDLTAQALALLGCIELTTGSYDEAWRRAQESLALVHPFSFALLVSGHAARGLGQTDRACSCYRQAFCAAARTKSVLRLLYALPGTALLLADQGQVERAVELYALASRYPMVANSRQIEDVVGRHIRAAASALPPEVVAAAQERGRARELWATAEELLAELEG